ncbi:hypothetical protein [Luteolibacter soli]|uniref:Uncharacterized protein n=1 Tax=Luteolibacter soli TaxID=3135280 RepID=A0ABU9B4E5_9BACT
MAHENREEIISALLPYLEDSSDYSRYLDAMAAKGSPSASLQVAKALLMSYSFSGDQGLLREAIDALKVACDSEDFASRHIYAAAVAAQAVKDAGSGNANLTAAVKWLAESADKGKPVPYDFRCPLVGDIYGVKELFSPAFYGAVINHILAVRVTSSPVLDAISGDRLSKLPGADKIKTATEEFIDKQARHKETQDKSRELCRLAIASYEHILRDALTDDERCLAELLRYTAKSDTETNSPVVLNDWIHKSEVEFQRIRNLYVGKLGEL